MRSRQAAVGDNSEFIGEFLVESTENLDQLDRDLLALEAEPGDPQRLASIFRTVHTIKGNSGFFGFSRLGALAHSGEHLLGRLRDGKLTLDDRVTGTLYSMVDAVRSILQSTVRVDVDLLASILDLVGELVLARNELRSVETEDPAVLAATQRIHAVTNALQETAVKTRMQPVDLVRSGAAVHDEAELARCRPRPLSRLSDSGGTAGGPATRRRRPGGIDSITRHPGMIMLGHHDKARIERLRQAAAKKGRVVRVVDQKTAVVPLHADTLADPNKLLASIRSLVELVPER